MRAIEITTPGGPEVLRVAEMPRPQPGAGELLIRVHAAGVNRPDVLQRRGAYAPPAGAPNTPGLEVAGVVEEGAASGFKPGDAVCALIAGGGYAEYCTAPAGQTLPVPRGLSFAEAAGLPETFFTEAPHHLEQLQSLYSVMSTLSREPLIHSSCYTKVSHLPLL